MVFYNLFIFLNNSEAVNDIRWLVIELLEDEQLEASDPFSALLSHHCFLPLSKFYGKADREINSGGISSSAFFLL